MICLEKKIDTVLTKKSDQAALSVFLSELDINKREHIKKRLK